MGKHNFILGYLISWYVSTGFCNAYQPIPAPPSDPDSGQDPHDEEYMDARPDKEEMEEAIENFLSRLEKQEERGFRDLHVRAALASTSSRTIFVSVRGHQGWLPPQRGRRCGGYVHTFRFTFVPSCTGSQVVYKKGYPMLSQSRLSIS